MRGRRFNACVAALMNLYGVSQATAQSRWFRAERRIAYNAIKVWETMEIKRAAELAAKLSARAQT